MKRLRTVLALATAIFVLPPSAIGQGGNTRTLATGQHLTGELSANDAQRASGKYEDVYVIQGRRGERVDLRLLSTEFDPFLMVTGPAGFSRSNDDEEGQTNSTNSRLVLEFPQDGSYRVAVTSFQTGETGSYRLQAAPAAAGLAVTAPENAQPIRIGQALNGSFAAGDGRLPSGAFRDQYRFSARRGQRVRIELNGGKELDTLLMLRRPDGTVDTNDDSEVNGQPSLNSRIDTVLAEDGDYVIVATTYEAQATGQYQLRLAVGEDSPRQAEVIGGRRVIALLVGVSDYGGRVSNLPNTDNDARQIYQSLNNAGMLHPASQVLVNGQATRRNVMAAFRRAAAAAGPDDLFLFFYSGHGGQVPVQVSAAELDGKAETIELYDGALRDVELAPLFGSVRGRMSVLAIDACFAGGFRSLINRPDIMGLFSSEEDLTSVVAERFQAGGYLSYFLRAGLGGEADVDGDRIVTAGELSTYVRRRFRREGDIPAETGDSQQNYQNLLVERGGIRVDDVVVRLASAGGPARSARPANVDQPVRRAAQTQRFQDDEDEGYYEEEEGEGKK